MYDIDSELARAVSAHRSNNIELAEELYRAILSIDPFRVDANHNLGLILGKSGRLEEAIEHFQKAVDVRPTNITHLRTYITLLLENGRLEDAIRLLDGTNRYGVPREDLAELRKMCVKSKIAEQNGIPLFYDNSITSLLTYHTDDVSDGIFAGFCQLVLNAKDRFVEPTARLNVSCKTFKRDRTIPSEALVFSQGTHSIIKWKEHDVYKSVFDMAIYWMLLQELKPDCIIEIGSGSGGSAVWLADIARALGLNTKIFSYDINRPELIYPNVEFIEFDLNLIPGASIPLAKDWSGRKLVIEDAHTNIIATLKEVDQQLRSGDYLIVEDSDIKSTELQEFATLMVDKYVSDQYYLDFFGINGTSAKNAIYKVC